MVQPEPEGGRVKIAFEADAVTVAIDQLIPLKALRDGVKESRKYAQIVASVREIGLVEAPVIAPASDQDGGFYLLDGHLRVEALKDLGVAEVECLVSTDDETYTYNKRINRLAPIQEYRMIRRAIQRGVPEGKIAAALGINVQSVERRARMLNGICDEVSEILKEAPCPLGIFDILRRMAPPRQIEAAELMVGQGSYSTGFAKALLVATPDELLVKPPRKRGEEDAVTVAQISRMERELSSLQAQVKSVEETYGLDNLHLTVARGYLRTLIANGRVERWLARHRPEYLTEFVAIAEIETLAPPPVATAAAAAA
jgi:hypothetical protein